jgi:RNA polymerase primary sigma factor
VRVPCGQMATINRVYRAKDELMLKTGKEPSITELAAYTKMTEQEINTILSISQTAMSLENFDDDEDTSAPIDFLEQQIFTHAFVEIAESDLGNVLNKAMQTLNPREAKVIACHFGVENDIEMTLQEIGAELHLTRERVRQIQVMALNKMKRHYGEQLVSFL